eukprot:g419.t1
MSTTETYKTRTIEDIQAEIDSLDEQIATQQDDGYASEGNDYEVYEDELPSLDQSFGSIVVVVGLPVTVEAKVPKLVAVVQKLFKKYDSRFNEDTKDIFMPVDSTTGKTLGTVFVELSTVKQARKAQEEVNEWKLTKTHKLYTYMFDDMIRVMRTPPDYNAPPAAKFQARDDLYSYLVDENSRDQFAIRQDKSTEIYWIHGPTAQPPEVAYDGARERASGRTWCERQVSWSPNGTFFVTFHPQGMVLWGGVSFEKVTRFEHKEVVQVHFSPNEQYVVTWNGATSSRNEKDSRPVVVWDRRTGESLRKFAYNPEVHGDWPCFQFSHDDKYFARKDADKESKLIKVYNSDTCKLLDKRSLRAPGVQEFKWSPCGYDTKNGGIERNGGTPVLSYWSPEKEEDSTPASIRLIAIPERTVLRTITRSMVDRVELHWQPRGEYLAVQVLRHKKSKKTHYTNFEIFRMKNLHKDIAVEHFKQTEEVSQFRWEPNGNRFAYIYGDSSTKGNVDVYTMGDASNKGKMEMLYTIENRQANRLFWSPMGNFLVIAGLDNINGQLEFWDTDNEQSMSTQEHFMCNQICWDPSGRVCCTAVCQPMMFGSMSMRYQLENGFKLWTFQGAPMYETQRQNFYSFEWRPRPQLLLSTEEQKLVKKNLKQKIEGYAERDRLAAKEKADAKTAKQRSQIDNFMASMQRRHAEFLQLENERRQLGIEVKDDQDYETVVTVTEVVLSRAEEIID